MLFKVRAVYNEQDSVLNRNTAIKNTKNDDENSIDFFSLVKGINPNDDNEKLNTSFTLNYLDKHNAFAGLSIDDIRTFRGILKDGMVKGEELSKLSFSQLKRFERAFGEYSTVKVDDKKEHLIVPSGISYDNTSSMMLDVIDFTNDDKFNNSLVQTVKQLGAEGAFDTNEGLRKIIDFFTELQTNLGQVALGDNPHPGFIVKDENESPFFYAEKFRGMKDSVYINFHDFLETYIPMLLLQLQKSKSVVNSQTYDTYKNYANIYEKIRDNYNKI
ncbi:MAG: hypothetical protein KGV43_01965 [Arcobacter sp.]|nr:hypothetical protein [Arcobacter sp.]